MVKTLDMVTFTMRRCSQPGCSDNNRTQGERNSREVAEAQVIASPPELQHNYLLQSEQTNISLVRVLKQHIHPTVLLQSSFCLQFGTTIAERKKKSTETEGEMIEGQTMSFYVNTRGLKKLKHV